MSRIARHAVFLALFQIINIVRVGACLAVVVNTSDAKNAVLNQPGGVANVVGVRVRQNDLVKPVAISLVQFLPQFIALVNVAGIDKNILFQRLN